MFLSNMCRMGLRPSTFMFTRRAFAVSVGDLGSIKREDVLASDSKWMGSYVSAVAEAGDDSGAHSENIDEYFRKNFRKMSSAQAHDVLS